MAEMKRLAVNMMEFEDQILLLLYQTRCALPTAFALFFDDDVSSEVKREAFHQFTSDEELIEMVIAVIEMDLVDFGNIPEEPTVLSLKHPELTLLVDDDINT